MSDEPKPEKSFNFENAFNVLQERCKEIFDISEYLGKPAFNWNDNYNILCSIANKAQNIMDITELCLDPVAGMIGHKESDEPEQKSKPIPKLCAMCGELVQNNVCIRCGNDYS